MLGADVNNLRFLIQICKGIIRSHRVRRTVMFYIVLVVLVQAFLGATFFWMWLRVHPWYFLGYWGVCAWLTATAVLLAIFDMAMVRLAAKRAEEQLRQDILHEKPSDSSHDSHPT
jgi:hypothetical protein